jgi:hypothetical protein
MDRRPGGITHRAGRNFPRERGSLARPSHGPPIAPWAPSRDGRASRQNSPLIPSGPYHRPRPLTSLRTTRSRTAPTVAWMMAFSIPAARWIPKRGSSQLPIRAPTIPIPKSAMRPWPVPRTRWLPSHPATRPTTRMTRIPSSDIDPSPTVRLGREHAGARHERQPAPRRCDRASPVP